MRLNVAILVIFFLSSCSIFVQDKRPPLRLVDATKQKFIGGAPGSGTSTHYKFKLLTHTEQSLTIDTVWIGSRPYSPRLLKQQEDAGDTLLVHVVKHHKSDYLTKLRKRKTVAEDTTLKEGTHQNTSPPRPYSGVGLISYQLGKKGRQKYLKVASFRELDTIAFP